MVVQKRPGQKPSKSRRIPRDTDLPPSMVDKLTVAGVFKALGVNPKDKSAQSTVSKIDTAARRYVHIYKGGINKYPKAIDQRKTARTIRRHASALWRSISHDPEVSKRFFLALEKFSDPKFTKLCTKDGKALLNKESYLQELLAAFENAAQTAAERSYAKRGSPRKFEAEVDLAGWILNENPSLFTSHARKRENGSMRIKRTDYVRLDDVVARIMQAALKVVRLRNPHTKNEIEADDVLSAANSAVETLAEDYAVNSYVWTEDDEASEEQASKDRWYKK